MTHVPSPHSMRPSLSIAVVTASMLMALALPASAADLKKLADELVNQSEPPAAIDSGLDSDGDLDSDGHGDVSARGIEKSDIRRGMKVDEGNALNARQAAEEKTPAATPDSRRAGDPIPGIDITRPGPQFPGIDITVNQGH